MDSVRKILKNVNHSKWVNDHEDKKNGEEDTVSPLDILDYVYAVLYSPIYRNKYKDFLKSDFPRVPIAKDEKSFWKLVELGAKLRELHLLEDSELSHLNTTFTITGDNLIEIIEYEGDKVYINESQYFGNVSEEAWEFYIGGYQPAQKWLKDRKDKKLEYEDIIHYQKIIKVLVETDIIMKEIDTINSLAM